MDVTACLNLLKESRGRGAVQVFLPSLGREVTVKQINVGMQKTVSKVAISGGASFYSTLVALAVELTDGAVSPQSITDIDLMKILCVVKLNNIFEPISYRITCGKCNEQSIYSIDFKEFLERLSKISWEKRTLKFDGTFGHVEIDVSLPSVADIAALKAIEEIEGTSEDSSKMLATFVKAIRIGNEAVEGIDASFSEKVKVLDALPGAVLADKDSLPKTVSTEMIPKIESAAYDVVCKKCNERISSVLTVDSFF